MLFSSCLAVGAQKYKTLNIFRVQRAVKLAADGFRGSFGSFKLEVRSKLTVQNFQIEPKENVHNKTTALAQLFSIRAFTLILQIDPWCGRLKSLYFTLCTLEMEIERDVVVFKV